MSSCNVNGVFTNNTKLMMLATEFFVLNTKLSEMAILASKDSTAAKNVTFSGARSDDYNFYNITSDASVANIVFSVKKPYILANPLF